MRQPVAQPLARIRKTVLPAMRCRLRIRATPRVVARQTALPFHDIPVDVRFLLPALEHPGEHAPFRTCKNPDALGQSLEVHLRGTYHADRRQDHSPTASTALAAHRLAERLAYLPRQNAQMYIHYVKSRIMQLSAAGSQSAISPPPRP